MVHPGELAAAVKLFDVVMQLSKPLLARLVLGMKSWSTAGQGACSFRIGWRLCSVAAIAGASVSISATPVLGNCLQDLPGNFVYQIQGCTHCHGVAGSLRLRDETPTPADDTSLHQRITRPDYSFSTFLSRVQNGFGLMLARPQVCVDNVRLIYEHLGGTEPVPQTSNPFDIPDALPLADCDRQPTAPGCQTTTTLSVAEEAMRLAIRRRAQEVARQRYEEAEEHRRLERLAALGRDLKRHSFYIALTTSQCKSDEDLRADRISQFATPIERACRMGHVKESTATRRTLAEILDGTRPPDRDPDNRGGGFAAGFISEPGFERGYVDVNVGEKKCIVPEIAAGRRKVRWTCGLVRNGTVTCPEQTTIVKVHRHRTRILIHCMKGDGWGEFERDLKRVHRSGQLRR